MMDTQDGAQSPDGAAMSPDSGRGKLQLPLSCDPPGLGNPAKQLVWIVSGIFIISVDQMSQVPTT